MIDIVIPLGSGSSFDNDELRIALRSIERNVPNAGKIFVVSDNAPKWLRNVEILNVSDFFTNNKDANLFNKVLTAALNPRLSQNFILWSDDQVALKPIDGSRLRVWNNRGSGSFRDDKRRWHRRMTATFERLKSIGKTLDYNWDSHTPHLQNKDDVIRVLSAVDYATTPGFCLDTLLLGSVGAPKGSEQSGVKLTAESETPPDGWKLENSDKWFVGYNDAAFQTGLREELFRQFPQPSRWESDTAINDYRQIQIIQFFSGEDYLPALVASYSFKKHGGMNGAKHLLYTDNPKIADLPNIAQIYDEIRPINEFTNILSAIDWNDRIFGATEKTVKRCITCWGKHLAWLSTKTPQNGFTILLDYDTVTVGQMRGCLPTELEKTLSGNPVGKIINGSRASLNGGLLVKNERFEAEDAMTESLWDPVKYRKARSLHPGVNETGIAWFICQRNGINQVQPVSNQYNYRIKLYKSGKAHLRGKRLLHYVGKLKPWNAPDDKRSQPWIEARKELEEDLGI